MTTDQTDHNPPDDTPIARLRRRRLSLVWLIPIVAAAIALYLGWRTLSQRGPTITISFRTADGLVAGQTLTKFKAVDLGTVETIRLSQDMSRVLVNVRMRREAEPQLTDNARFWVVRPRVAGGNISGLETLVSGAYIEFDPGPPNGHPERNFTGLENPPSVRSDEPGKTFTLRADRLGSIGVGAPVFFRDIPVGEVLAYDPPALGGHVNIHAFVRKPYDSYVRADSRFWNASGVAVQFGAQGVKLQLESLQALFAGGIGFDTPPEAYNEAPVRTGALFTLYADEQSAISAASRDRLNFMLYFQDSVQGLRPGGAVLLYGLPVGNVLDVRLQYDPAKKDFRVAVQIAVDRDPIAQAVGGIRSDATVAARDLAARGLRAKLQTMSYLTGQRVVSLELGPTVPTDRIHATGGAIVLPSEAGGFDNIVGSVNDIVSKLNRMPFEQIGDNLNRTLASLNSVAASPDLKRSLRALSATLADAQSLAHKADRNLGPALERLPQIAADLQQTVQRANSTIGTIERGYGADSEFRRNLDRLMIQANDTARSIRLLADFLDRHPEALIRGRGAKGSER